MMPVPDFKYPRYSQTPTENRKKTGTVIYKEETGDRYRLYV